MTDRERQRRASIFTRLERMKQDAEALEQLLARPADQAWAIEQRARIRLFRVELMRRIQQPPAQGEAL